MSTELLQVISDNDQDLAACREWLAQASENDLLRVWDVIQRVYDDPAMEAMSRFAQLALAELLVEMHLNCPPA